MTVARQHEVGRFQVAMDDSFFVCRFQRFGYFRGELKGVADRHGSGEKPVTETLAFNILHNDEVLALGFADFVDVADVRVIECRRGLRLVQEALAGRRILLQFPGEKFESDLATQRRVVGQKDLTHASCAEFLNDSIMRDGFANHSEYFHRQFAPCNDNHLNLRALYSACVVIDS